MADKLVSVNDDYDFPAPVAARQAARLGDATTAEGKALAGTYVRFVDTAGNPIDGSLVTIVVNMALKEIEDIIVEDI